MEGILRMDGMAEEKKKSSTIILNYKGQNIVGIPITKYKLEKLEKAGVVKGKNKGTVVLAYGNNVLPLDVWKMIRPEVSHLLSSGKLVEVNVDGDVEEVVDKSLKATVVKEIKTTDLSDMKVKDAIAIIRDTNTIMHLEAFRKTTDVASIIKAIDDQITKVNKKSGKED